MCEEWETALSLLMDPEKERKLRINHNKLALNCTLKEGE